MGVAETQTVFILFTDIFRSSHFSETYPEEFKKLLRRHNVITEEAAKSNQCEVLKNLGDGYLTVFGQPTQALECAISVQREFAKLPPLPDGSKILLRVAMHAGTPYRLPEANEYFGQPLNRCSRICQVCHPGQVLISEAVRQHIDETPKDCELTDLGEHYLRDLSEPVRLYQLYHPEFQERRFPPLASLSPNRHNLPLQVNPFIGRWQQIQELRRLVLEGRRRLITLTAAGGYGKTRLATQLCAELAPHYEHGVFLVPLEPVSAPDHVVGTAADALGFQFYSAKDPKQQLLDYLREKQMLLLFDNFEHLMEARELLNDILHMAPGVSLLVTSREPLRVQAEQVFILEPLSVTDGIDATTEGLDYPEAVELFIDRAKAVKHDLALSPAYLASIQQTCERLEGVPLAIEMTAAWADTFSPDQILTQVDKQLELTSRMADVPERHRSVRASLDWSYNLLKEELRAALLRLSVFKGGFFPQAASEVLERSDALPVLSELKRKNWLYTVEALGEMRYAMRGSEREYALEKLRESADWEATALRHSRHFADLLEREAKELAGHKQLEAVKQLGTEIQNIYAALETALSPAYGGKLLLPFAKHLASYLDVVSRWQEGLPWYERIREHAEKLEDPALRMHALLGLAWLLWRLGLYDESEKAASAARELAQEVGDRKPLARALGNMGNVARDQGRFEEAEELYQESLQIKREVGDRTGIAGSLQGLGLVAWDQGRYEEAEKLYQESLKIEREIGDLYGIVESLWGLGLVVCGLGRYEEAEKLHKQSLQLGREIGDRSGIATSLCCLGLVAYHQVHYEEAQKLVSESLLMFRRIGARNGVSSCLFILGTVCIRLERIADACKYLKEALQVSRDIGARNVGTWALVTSGNLLVKTRHLKESTVFLFGAEHQAKEMNFKLEPMTQGELDEAMAKLKEALSEEELAEAKTRAEAMTLEELTEYALKTLEGLNL